MNKRKSEDGGKTTGPDKKSKPNGKLDSYTENVPQVLTGFELRGLNSKDIPTGLPKLPEILNKTLEAAVFTHVGITKGNSSALSYEKLEWIGDTYIEHTVTLLISQTFNSLSTGQCSQLREKFVKNTNLADFASRYGFYERAQLPDAFKDDTFASHAKQESRVKIMGDMFEAYAAAIVLSDPVNGLATMSKWIKDLLSMVLRKEIFAEEEKGMRREDNPIWNLGWTQAATTKPERVPKERLSQAIGCKGVTISYEDESRPFKGQDKLTMFSVGVYLTGWGEKKKLLGVGKAVGKKEAGQLAAAAVLRNEKQLQVYVERKRLHEERVRQEQAIIAVQEGAVA